MYLTVKDIALFLCAGIMTVMFCRHPATAQFEHHVLGARPASFGGMGVALKGDPWAAFGNPALYASIRNITASAAYIPGRFALSELQSSAATAIAPFSFFTAALAVHRFGFDLYSETTLALSGGYSVSDRFAVGTTLNWYHLSIERYGSAATLGIDAGIRADITEKLSTGFAVANINRPVIGQSKNTLPQIIRAGLMYRPHPLINIIAEIEKDIIFEPEFRFGAEYMPAESFRIRAGMNDRPTRASGGFSINHRSIQLDYALQWHYELGQTHFLTLTFTLPARRKQEPVARPGIQTRTDVRPSIAIEHLLLHTEIIPRIQNPAVVSLLRFINTAQVSDLISLPRIGEVMAQRIISYRSEHGLFRSLQELQNVPGIGERTIENILDYWHERLHSGER